MMTELFESKSMPFYKFGDILFLEKIPKKYWIDFIVDGFKRTGKIISENIAAQIADEMENHPYFVQQLAHSVWNTVKKVCTRNDYLSSLESLLTQHTILFQREVNSLTNHQVNFLKALCSNVTKFNSVEILRSFRLGTSGNVKRIKESLVNKEIIDITSQKIEFIDPLFRIWFSTVYMKPEHQIQ